MNFKWSAQAAKASQILKRTLTEARVLLLADLTKSIAV